MNRLTTLALSGLSLSSTAVATGVLLPLYVYPSQDFGDDAANWLPAFNAMEDYPSVPWLAVINPGNGPGATLNPGNDDQNYIDGTAKLNSHDNVQTIGYVRTDYATSDLDELKTNITAWKNWDTYSEQNIAVDGIFFDESADDYTYMEAATSLARDIFGEDVVTICNFGTRAEAEYYDICSVIVAFESCLNCADAPPYTGQPIISDNIPSGKEGEAAIIVHDFTGTASDGSTADAALLQSYEETIKENGVGWSYFCSGPYSSITTGPATVRENAKDLA